VSRPKGGYKLADGTKVPGVTTIIGRFKDSGGLIHWAWQQGSEGLDFRETRDDAANAGLLAHDLVDWHLTGNDDAKIQASFAFKVASDMVTQDAADKAMKAYENFGAWQILANLKIISTEESLVSEKHRFGGTYDGIAIAEIDGKRSLCDWKTSNAVYRDYAIQLAAYKGLWDENHPDEPITGGFHLVRFSKTDADFEHRYFGELELAWQQFLLLRQAYENDKLLKARIR
jgi:hypothetical protein